MKIAAVICEFNPFHNGHKYLLDEIKNQGFDGIICVMSGSFTQRGDAAICDKFSRTKTALENGCDLVIELPTPYAVASAGYFAKGGVEIIAGTGVVDTVFFASEAGDISLLEKAALAVEDEKVQSLLKEQLDNGQYYPNALQKAVLEVYGEATAEVFDSPNNVLGIEYIKELKKYGIKAKTILRKGAAHNGTEVYGSIASASYIRNRILNGEDISNLTPSGDFSNPASLYFGERVIINTLRKLSVEEIAELADVNEGLENRIYTAARSQATLDGLLSEIKTKRYTMARLRRITVSAILGITKELQGLPVSYLRILGITKQGEKILSRIANNTNLPIITRVSPALRELNDNAARLLLCDINATDTRTAFEKSVTACGKDFTHGFIKI